MSENPLTLEEVVGWFRLMERTLANSGVRVAAVRERRALLPAMPGLIPARFRVTNSLSQTRETARNAPR